MSFVSQLSSALLRWIDEVGGQTVAAVQYCGVIGNPSSGSNLQFAPGAFPEAPEQPIRGLPVGLSQAASAVDWSTDRLSVCPVHVEACPVPCQLANTGDSDVHVPHKQVSREAAYLYTYAPAA
jgi:hypothetical protein